MKLTAFNYWRGQATEEMIKAVNSPVVEFAASHELHAAQNAFRASKAIVAAVTPSRVCAARHDPQFVDVAGRHLKYSVWMQP